MLPLRNLKLENEMTQENKELVLKYLCMAQPYGVKFKDDSEEDSQKLHYVLNEDVYSKKYPRLPYWIETIKPYLRPMLSMTEDEYHELEGLLQKDNFRLNEETAYIEIDWLLKNHFDFMGLIEKDLALDCTGLHIYD